MDLNNIAAALSSTGLIIRGGFYPDDGGTLVLVGNAGVDMWAAFTAAATPEQRQFDTNPLDNWTRGVVQAVADGLGCRAHFPFTGPPYHPFQQWALKAGGVFTSPIGPLIHSQFGLWHAYRGALVFAERLALDTPPGGDSPCRTCADKPCLSACPADVFASGQYDVPACVSHVTSAAGGDCQNAGCLARRACPIGEEYAYSREQAGFHMAKFLKAQGPV